MLTHQRSQVIGFFIIFGIIALVALLMWLPFLKLLALGAILAILFFPVYSKILKLTKHESVAAFFTLVIILLIVIIPLYLIGQVLFNELINLYNQLKTGGLTINKADIIQHLPAQVQAFAARFFQDFSQKLSGFTANAFTGITNLISNVAGFIVSFILVAFTVYYLLRDGAKLKIYFNSIFPLSEEHENLIVAKLEMAVSGVVKGSFLIALIQGAVALVGFLIFGLPQPFLWAAFTVLAALVPNIGTAVALVPAVLYLFITGHIGQGIGLLIWGAVAVGTIDNIVSPKLVGSRTQTHPLLILFGVIGGLQLFGIMGFLLGPILMAVFVTLLDIYRIDLKKYLEK